MTTWYEKDDLAEEDQSTITKGTVEKIDFPLDYKGGAMLLSEAKRKFPDHYLWGDWPACGDSPVSPEPPPDSWVELAPNQNPSCRGFRSREEIVAKVWRMKLKGIIDSMTAEEVFSLRHVVTQHRGSSR